MLNKTEFFNRITKLKKPIKSKTGKASYADFELRDNILSFRRINTNQTWQLDLDQVYDIYKSNQFINTTVIKKHTGGRTNSPSVAILMAINCIDVDGNRINH